MNDAKRKYAKKCKTREITFYLHEVELYNFSKTINFSKFVKTALKEFKAVIEKDEQLERTKREYGNRTL